MRIVVTGGAGFIGSHLTERLLHDGHHVIVVDNLLTGHRANLADVLDHPRLAFVELDVTASWAPVDDVTGGAVDRVFHLACPASPVHYQKTPVATVSTNVIGTLHALQFALRHDARLLLTSTSEVYGDPEVHPQPESYAGNVNCVGPRACYDEGKRVAETLCFDFHRQHNVEVRVARVFNTIGARMAPDDGRVVSNFAIQALQGEPLTVYGDGAQTRSFCAVSDLIDGLLLLMESNEMGPINLGNDVEVSMRELANEVRRVLDVDVDIVHLPLPQDDPARRCPDLQLAQNKLHHHPRVGWQDALRETVESLRRRR